MIQLFRGYIKFDFFEFLFGNVFLIVGKLIKSIFIILNVKVGL